MREYEVMIVLRADLSDEDRSTQIQAFTNWITDEGGTITQSDHWGRRHLAYPIAKQRDGYYLLLKAAMPSDTLFELERSLRISENILRFLITREEDE